MAYQQPGISPKLGDTPEYVAQVTIAVKPDGTHCVWDELTGPEGRQEYASAQEAITAAGKLLQGASPEGAAPEANPAAMWDKMAAEADKRRETY